MAGTSPISLGKVNKPTIVQNQYLGRQLAAMDQTISEVSHGSPQTTTQPYTWALDTAGRGSLRCPERGNNEQVSGNMIQGTGVKSFSAEGDLRLVPNCKPAGRLLFSSSVVQDVAGPLSLQDTPIGLGPGRRAPHDPA